MISADLKFLTSPQIEMDQVENPKQSACRRKAVVPQ